MERQHRARFDRRTALCALGAGGTAWLTGVADLLARDAGAGAKKRPAKSVILLWLAGGPSQLETFDPHPGARIAAGTPAIKTAVRGIQLAAGFERLADQLQSVALVRSLVSQEGDHERGTYLLKTGYRPDPTVVHPSIGAICCHHLPRGQTEIPRHISILPGTWPARGGFLGAKLDAFKVWNSGGQLPDVRARVDQPRARRRFEDLGVVERTFAGGRAEAVRATEHMQTIGRAQRMMTSEQLAALDIRSEPAAVRDRYGDTPFGRGCLVARRLVQVGVRCVEVTLPGWDSHVSNHAIHGQLVSTLDPAFAALLGDLREHALWQNTIVLCGGEFGRTPRLNPLEGRDHWPHGFSYALAGGPLRGGVTVGETDPEGGRQVSDPRGVADIHATVLSALGLDPAHENVTPAGRPIKLSDGTPIAELL